MCPRAYTVRPHVYMRTVRPSAGHELLFAPGQGVVEAHDERQCLDDGQSATIDGLACVRCTRPRRARRAPSGRKARSTAACAGAAPVPSRSIAVRDGRRQRRGVGRRPAQQFRIPARHFRHQGPIGGFERNVQRERVGSLRVRRFYQHRSAPCDSRRQIRPCASSQSRSICALSAARSSNLRSSRSHSRTRAAGVRRTARARRRAGRSRPSACCRRSWAARRRWSRPDARRRPPRRGSRRCRSAGSSGFAVCRLAVGHAQLPAAAVAAHDHALDDVVDGRAAPRPRPRGPRPTAAARGCSTRRSPCRAPDRSSRCETPVLSERAQQRERARAVAAEQEVLADPDFGHAQPFISTVSTKASGSQRDTSRVKRTIATPPRPARSNAASFWSSVMRSGGALSGRSTCGRVRIEDHARRPCRRARRRARRTCSSSA